MIALLIIGLFNKVRVPCMQMTWPDEAEAAGVQKATGGVAMRTVDSVLGMLKSPVAGMLLGLGKTAACGCISAFIAVATSLYAWITRGKTNSGKSRAVKTP